MSPPNTTAVSVTMPDNFSGLLFQLVALILVVLVGVPGNCLILRVYWTKTLKTSTHVLIIGLAWADLCVCLLSVYRIYTRAVCLAGNQTSVSILSVIRLTAIAASIMLTSAIAADRYDCVCRPHRRLMTHRRAIVVAWAAVLFSVFINIPAIAQMFANEPIIQMLVIIFHILCFMTALVMIAFCYSKVYVTIRKHVKVDARNVIRRCSQFLASSATQSHLAHEPSFTAAPFSSDAKKIGTNRSSTLRQTFAARQDINQSKCDDRPSVFTTSNLHAVRANSRVADFLHERTRRVAPNAETSTALQRKTTRMLFVTSIVFLFTWLPYWIYIALVFASSDKSTFGVILSNLYATLYINNAVNPLIYGIANRRFRKDCVTVLSKIKPY